MLDRRDVVKRLLAGRGDLLVVPGLGAPTYDVAAAGDHPLNFYLWGAMGGAAMIADHPRAEAWREQAHRFLINSVSVPADAEVTIRVEGNRGTFESSAKYITDSQGRLEIADASRLFWSATRTMRASGTRWARRSTTARGSSVTVTSTAATRRLPGRSRSAQPKGWWTPRRPSSPSTSWATSSSTRRSRPCGGWTSAR